MAREDLAGRQHVDGSVSVRRAGGTTGGEKEDTRALRTPMFTGEDAAWPQGTDREVRDQEEEHQCPRSNGTVSQALPPSAVPRAANRSGTRTENGPGTGQRGQCPPSWSHGAPPRGTKLAETRLPGTGEGVHTGTQPAFGRDLF